jgi:hypothetical protein
MLYPAAHQGFCRTLRYDPFDSWITDSTERGSELARITPADAMATSVPAPIAMPASACRRVRDGLGVAGDHDHLDAQLVQRVDRWSRLLTHLVGRR